MKIVITGGKHEADFIIKMLKEEHHQLIVINQDIEFAEYISTNKSPLAKCIKNVYESALKHYEAREFGPACRDLYPLIANHNENYDTASLSLMAKSIEYLRKPPLPSFNGVEDLESK